MALKNSRGEATGESLTEDDHRRPQTTLEGLAKLRTAFGKNGTVTAGNASGIVDGAAAVVIMSLDEAGKRGILPLGRVVSWGIAGVDPKVMGRGPVPATKIALQKAGLTLDYIDLIEVNEAFAAQYLAVEKELGLDREKVNVNGGAIALGPSAGSDRHAAGHYAAVRTSAQKEEVWPGDGVHWRWAGDCDGGGEHELGSLTTEDTEVTEKLVFLRVPCVLRG